eukprot:31452-Pelagococcus_subviridis.AAC.6
MSSSATPAQSLMDSNMLAWISTSGSFASAAIKGGTTNATSDLTYAASTTAPVAGLTTLFSIAHLPARKMSGNDATAALRTSS